MTIPASARPAPIPKPTSLAPFVNRDGTLTQHGLELLNEWRNYLLGVSRIIPCECAAASNVYTLTPRAPACVIEKYCDYDAFTFVASASSTGAVTSLVSTASGNLATIKVYKTGGSAQAGNGDIAINLFYVAFYVDSLDGGNGGLVLK